MRRSQPCYYIPKSYTFHRCERLGLTSLALLWRREQGALLEDMIAGGVNAVLVKVACIGESTLLLRWLGTLPAHRVEGEPFGSQSAGNETTSHQTGVTPLNSDL